MSYANLGWLFYKKMYEKGDDAGHIKSTMDTLLNVNATDDSVNAPHSFTLKTIYPGLLIGSGYPHGLSVESDAKIGFYFDHTTGVPNVPGSSIKGILRSLFGCNKKDLYPEAKQQMIKELLKNDNLDVVALAAEMFDGIDAQTKKPLSVYARDRFLEARVLKTAGKLLCDDYITPHKDPIKNPVPIRFIKVQSGVEYEFSFLLNDGIITADEKLKLFFQLLQFHGVGAKTNVGYGQFESMDFVKFETNQKIKRDKANEVIAQLEAQQARKAREEELKSLPPEVQIFENNKSNMVDFIKTLDKNEFDEALKIPLARLIKAELQKTPSTWEKADKKALTRREVIEKILE
jgi:CRISPR-associated protein Cmr6